MQRGRVSVNDNFAKVVFTLKKFLTDPQQVLVPLLFQGNAWPYSGVNEKEISTCK